MINGIETRLSETVVSAVKDKKRIYMLLTGLKISMNFGPIFGVGLFSVLFKAKQQKLGSGRVHNAPSDLLTHQHAVFGY